MVTAPFELNEARIVDKKIAIRSAERVQRFFAFATPTITLLPAMAQPPIQ
jgi:hypothetical protein